MSGSRRMTGNSQVPRADALSRSASVETAAHVTVLSRRSGVMVLNMKHDSCVVALAFRW